MTRIQKRRSDCPISFGLDIFGDKWTLLIVRDLMFFGKMSYGDFLNSEEGIATNILADRLQTLERADVVKKTEDAKNKAKFVYSLTQKGIDLLPALLEIVLWGAKYDKQTGVPKDFLVQARNDKEGLTRQIRENIKRNKFLFQS